MSDIASNLNFEYNNQPLELVRRVKNVLETELRVIAEAQVRVSAETYDWIFLIFKKKPDFRGLLISLWFFIIFIFSIF